jgi:hypothetical protein
VPKGPVNFTVSDIDAPAQTLSVTVFSDNQKLLPDSNIIKTDLGNNNCSLVLYPVGKDGGTANVTVKVSMTKAAAAYSSSHSSSRSLAILCLPIWTKSICPPTEGWSLSLYRHRERPYRRSGQSQGHSVRS